MEVGGMDTWTSAVILTFGVIGAGLKFIDEAFDEGVFSKRSAALIAPFLVIAWMCLSIYDPSSATILFAILAGVILSGKIDNLVFKASSAVLILAALLSRKLNLLWFPFIVLTFLGIADERGNDYADANGMNRIVRFFFLHRFSMKLGVLVLCLTSYLPWAYLFAFLVFDTSYDLVGGLGQRMSVMRPGTFFFKDLSPDVSPERIQFVASCLKLDVANL
jgi:hypothetical protein